MNSKHKLKIRLILSVLVVMCKAFLDISDNQNIKTLSTILYAAEKIVTLLPSPKNEAKKRNRK
jgi:hypothetical protein